MTNWIWCQSQLVKLPVGSDIRSIHPLQRVTRMSQSHYHMIIVSINQSISSLAHSQHSLLSCLMHDGGIKELGQLKRSTKKYLSTATQCVKLICSLTYWTCLILAHYPSIQVSSNICSPLTILGFQDLGQTYQQLDLSAEWSSDHLVLYFKIS